MRGKGVQHTVKTVTTRITPRMGGEKLSLTIGLMTMMGSPPRGRGKGFSAAHGNALRRITPAWAGKSEGFRGTVQSQQDHPRVGGEKKIAG